MENQTVNLNVGIAVNLVKIIDACSKRGAFEGDEMLGVATTRQAIVDAVNALEAGQQATAEVEEVAEAATRKVLGGGKQA